MKMFDINYGFEVEKCRNEGIEKLLLQYHSV